MNNKIEEIFNWWNKFSNKDIRIISKTKDLYLHIDNNVLPHLLGLQYVNKDSRSMRGLRLYYYIKTNGIDEATLINKVNQVHGQKIAGQVSKRIDTFKNFMEELDKSILVNNSHVSSTIRSDYMAIKVDQKEFKHLAILETNGVASICGYENDKNINVFETYIVQGNNNYIKNSVDFEKIEQILFYEQGKNLWRAGSFNLEKDKILQDTVLGIADSDFDEVIKLIHNRENEIIRYRDFSFLPIRKFTNEENHMDLRGISKFLKTDGLINLGNADDFYKLVANNCDLFYCIDNRNIYVPGSNGFQQWNVPGNEILEMLRESQLKHECKIDKNNPIAKAISKIKNIEPKMISSEYDSGEEI